MEYEISGTIPFEFYELQRPEVLDILPHRVKHLEIPPSAYGSPSRKKMRWINIVIDTFGRDVDFIPTVDGVQLPVDTLNATGKRTLPVWFPDGTIGVDIGGILSGGDNAFEYYTLELENAAYEVLPPPTRFQTTPETNFGVAAKKRIRTIPFVLDTRDSDVVVTPIVDGTRITSATGIVKTNRPETSYIYFDKDVFGTDFQLELDGEEPHEFYELMKPESVEVLPVPRKADQIGPFEFDRSTWIRRLSISLITEGTGVTWEAFDGSTSVDAGTLATTPNEQKNYEVSFVKGSRAEVLRLVLNSNEPFHRMGGTIQVGLSGGETELKKVKFSS